jgi:hypothetical protein
MRGGATVKHERNATKRKRRPRRFAYRPEYYTLKQKTVNRHRNYLRKVLKKLREKKTRYGRVIRKTIQYDPSAVGVRRTRKAVPNSSARTSAPAPAARSSLAPNSFKATERDALIYKARELYGASDATKKIRAKFIRAYIGARSAAATPADALFAAENEIIVAAKAGAVGSAVAVAAPSAVAASAAVPSAAQAPASILNNNDDSANNDNNGANNDNNGANNDNNGAINNDDDDIEEIIMGMQWL